jgi:two-component system, OmpR family, phosphate regulon sensor histidine kinase PhoR
MFSRLQWRIAASYVLLIGVVLLGLGVYLIGLLREQQLGELEAQLQRQARLVADAVEYRVVSGAAASAELDPLAKRLGRDIGARITLIGADGTVLGDSESDPAMMDNHGTRPEVLAALRQGHGESERHSATLDQDLLYVAVPMQSNGQVIGVARVALPVLQIQESGNRVAAAVAGALLTAALLATVVAVLLARVTTRRVEALTHAARRLAGGVLDETLPVQGTDEVAELARTFNNMAASLGQHVRTVEDQRARLSAVLAHMADGVVIADYAGLVRLINPAAARLLRTAPTRAEGQSLMTVVRDHEVADTFRQTLAAAERAVEPRLVELGLPDGGRAIRVIASRLSGAGQGQVLLVLQDVTDLRRAELVRREFVANVSHELRTPVAGLKALVETLEDGALDDRGVARQFLGRMHVEVDGLAQLVEELLELSRIESGRVALNTRVLDLGPVVAAAAERLRPQAERQRLTLEVATDPDLPNVSADPDRIQQVVVNLVHNALKFTPPGGRVTVRVQPLENGVAVLVADTGEGISPEALPRLFERFYKVDKARATGGTGLGLAISKHLVQAHGGRIWAESPGEGRGATFTFWLPASSANV